jgi:hypothetical protein
MKPLLLRVSFFASIMLFTGCNDKLEKRHQIASDDKKKLGNIMRVQGTIASNYDDSEIRDMPAVAQLNEEQRIYILELLSAIFRLLEGTSDIQSEENTIFGEGKFYWPKDPEKPIKTERYYTHENFRMRGISLWIERKNVGGNWKKASLTVIPRNFPHGVYDMSLPASTFLEFELIKTVHEKRKDESIDNPVVFYFSHRKIRDMRLKIEARSDVVSVEEPYPRSFHHIQITRSSL